MAHGEVVWDGVEALRVWVVVLERISRLGFWEREANVRRVWRVAHCLQMLSSARRRLLAIEVAIVVVLLWCRNGGRESDPASPRSSTEVLRSLLTSSSAENATPHKGFAVGVHIRLLDEPLNKIINYKQD